MKKILIPTDFSENAKHAADFGVLLANKIQADIVLVYAYLAPDGTEPYVPANISLKGLYMDKVKAEEERIFKALDIGLSVSHRFVWDYPAEGIAYIAKKYGADLIVMGTKGASKMKGVFFGTNTARLIDLTSVPVLVVPEGTKPELPENLLLAVESEFLSERVSEDIEKWKSLLGSKVNALRISTQLSPAMVGEPLQIRKSRNNEVWDEFSEVYFENITEGLLEYSKGKRKTWLGIIHRERGFFKHVLKRSLAKKVSYECEVPLLVFSKKLK